MDEGDSTMNQARQRYYTVVDGSMLGIWTGLVVYTVSKHEPWADEAQAWLIARDYNWLQLVFHELRYEGHPPVWFGILSVAIHAFHLSYAYIGYIGAFCALMGICLLFFLAPFPRFLRYLTGFSFFFVYQYAVLARPYVLVPFLGFLAAHFYRKGKKQVISFACTLAVLIQVSSYGAIIALALGMSNAIELFPQRHYLSSNERKHVLISAFVVTISALLIAIILYPPADSFLMAQANAKTFDQHLWLVGEGLDGAFADSVFVTGAILILSAIWAKQRKHLPLLILSIGGTAFEYGFLRGYPQHQGLITVAFVVVLWTAWPSTREIASFSPNSNWLHRSLMTVVTILFAWQCIWSFQTIRRDWAGPYSGAIDAAKYLKAINADQLGCIGIGFWAVAVQPYFDHNIFANYGGPEDPASHHWSIEFYKHSDTLSPDQVRSRPRFVVVADEEGLPEVQPLIEGFKLWNYRLIHVSDGTRFFKDALGTHSLYLIFEREDPGR
jgi:hypothetical protein